ncbi:hypothetical protein PENVUL_c075G04653 [Penicillium vulpinum]|uniref:Uncharacterized protein n=1 Tax=Penicillium vulpinum TaxID=29845 RepID=A0A1V6RAE0_9EURO|nr:hypothetical protein PENVUL_c075G04653 [Penicillium vulpinum]
MSPSLSLHADPSGTDPTNNFCKRLGSPNLQVKTVTNKNRSVCFVTGEYPPGQYQEDRTDKRQQWINQEKYPGCKFHKAAEAPDDLYAYRMCS